MLRDIDRGTKSWHLPQLCLSSLVASAINPGRYYVGVKVRRVYNAHVILYKEHMQIIEREGIAWSVAGANILALRWSGLCSACAPQVPDHGYSFVQLFIE